MNGMGQVRSWRSFAFAATAPVSAVLLTVACGDGPTEPAPTPNRPPLPNGTIPVEVVAIGETAEVDVSPYFVDPDGDTLTYSAVISDPATASIAVANGVVTIVAAAQGEATVTVTGTDPGGLSAQQEFAVIVPNRGPEVTGAIPADTIFLGDTASLDVSGYFIDPDGDALTFAAETSDATVVTASAAGSVVTVVAETRGDATVAVRATDTEGLAVEQSFEVTVANRAPTPLSPIPAIEIDVGSVSTIAVSPHFEDPDGDVLTYVAATSDADITTTSVSDTLMTVEAVGEGVATVTVTATDSYGSSVDQEMTVTVVVPPPTIEDFISAAEADGSSGTARRGTPPAEGDGPSVSLPVSSLDVINGGTLRSPVTADDQFTTLYVFVGGVTDSSNSSREIGPSLRPQAMAGKAVDPRILRRSIAGAGDTALVDGYFQITLPAATRSVNLLLQFPQSLASTAFDLILGAESSAGLLGSFLRVPAAVTVVGTGDIQISLSWDTNADLDLHVVEPSGEEIYYYNSISNSGGTLDLDSNAECSRGPRNENVTWPSGRAPRGHYVVRVNHWSNCGARLTNYVVRVIAGEHSEVHTGSFTGPGNRGGRGDGITITTFLFGSGAAVAITGTDPPVLLEGQAATITGFGFSRIAAWNRVSIGGIDAKVTAATATSLSIDVPRSDCLPPRTAQLHVTSPQGAATGTVSVSPRSRDDLELDRYWYRYTYAGNGCLHLPGNVSGGEYLIGVTSTSETADFLAQVVLTGMPGNPAVVVPDLIAGGPESGTASLAGSLDVRPDDVAPLSTHMSVPSVELSGPTRNHAAHNGLMARSLALLEELGRTGPTPPARSMQADTLAVGDIVTLFEDRPNCDSGKQVLALVRFVGENTIWLDDLDNPHYGPPGGPTGFSDGELEALDAFYTTHVKSVLDAYFGKLSDVDGDGRVHVLMTKELNERNNLARVVPQDLLPRHVCRTSNEAEIMYFQAPDPNGSHGDPIHKDSLLEQYRIWLAHEATHLVQFNAAHGIGTAPPETIIGRWELEGGATLAQELVAYRLFGHGSGRNMGYEEYLQGEEWYKKGWLLDLLQFFGLDPGGNGLSRVPGAPEQCSWVVSDGPCSFRAVYGVPSLLLRWAMDRWSDPDGEKELMKRLTQSLMGSLTQSPRMGLASLAEGGGWRIEQLLASFYIALWADGRPAGDGRVWNTIRSWDLHDIISGHYGSTSARPQLVEPHRSTSARPRLEADIRAGSSLFLHWTTSDPLAPTSIKVVSRTTGEPVDPIFVWAWRLR